jgi:ATP-dependent Lon protease
VLLVPLLRETLLPGERRPIDVLGIDRELSSHLATLGSGAEVCTITIASAVEVPSLVGGRFGTVAVVERGEASAAAPNGPVLLRGMRRASIASAKIEAKRAAATLVVHDDADDLVPAASAAASILRAIAEGALPEAATWRTSLDESLAALARAVCPPDERGSLVSAERAAMLARLETTLKATRPARDAAVALEKVASTLPTGNADASAAAEPVPVPETQRRRLWAQVVEIQRKLDLYDLDKHELGSDIARLAKRLSQAGLRDEAKAVADRELRLLRGIDASHHDYSTIFSHLDLISRLPWHTSTAASLDLANVQAMLDASHAGLDRAKTRILEYLAVKKLGGTGASTVLCFGGPPGVGKTTIASAIAKALGRPFVRVALGGVHDESEIRGHRRTYTAANEGRILAGMAQCTTNDPVMLLDEIDKLGTERARSPMAALLEVLDPEQHTHFVDNFLSVPYDLSNVLFVCTANDLGRIDPVLRDRLEVIELDGYTVNEKLDIAAAHLLGRLATEHGTDRLDVPRDTMAWLVERYTREGGVRELKRVLARLYRTRALALAKLEEGVTRPTPETLTPQEAERVLGPARYREPAATSSLPPGVVLGLATSQSQGSLLRVEVATAPSKAKAKGEVVLTGSLGEVMRESVRTVLGRLRTNAQAYGLDDEAFHRDVYVHLPDAATPKDGPSAGCALFAAVLSALLGTPARADVAITGELSLTGEVLAVGGIRAKVIAAERAGLRVVVVPEENRADVPPGLTIEVVYAVRDTDVARVLLDRDVHGASSERRPTKSPANASTTKAVRPAPSPRTRGRA